MQKGWWAGLVIGLLVTFLIFTAGFYAGNNITGNAFLDFLKKPSDQLTVQRAPQITTCPGSSLIIKIGETKITSDGDEIKASTINYIEKKAVVEFDKKPVELELGKLEVIGDDWVALKSVTYDTIEISLGKTKKAYVPVDNTPSVTGVNIPGGRTPNVQTNPVNVPTFTCNPISPRAGAEGGAGGAGAGNIRAVSPGAAVPGSGYMARKTGTEWCAQESYDFCSIVFKVPENPASGQIWKCGTDVTCNDQGICTVTDDRGTLHTVNIRCCNNNF